MDLIFSAFLYLLLAAFLAAVIFAPRRGLLARWRSSRLDARRHRIEDALKYIFNRQQEDDPASVDALAGALSLTKQQAMNLASDLRSQGLVQANQRDLILTPEGQRWALQVVRAHRLWERYLVDEARMPLEQVHNIAQKREHDMTTSQIDALDASLGHPALDPHGDPIPSAGGKLRKSGGHQPEDLPLNQLEVGQSGQIFHLEDEPPVAYAQLVAAGLSLGQVVTVLERTPQKVVLTSGVNEMVIAPAIASNVFLRPLAQPEVRPPDVLPLSELHHLDAAEIVELDDACQGFTRRRFLDLGLTPGTVISPELENAFRDPRGYRVRGTLIALRDDQADLIWVRPVGSAK